jgi:hypothetical protein
MSLPHHTPNHCGLLLIASVLQALSKIVEFISIWEFTGKRDFARRWWQVLISCLSVTGFLRIGRYGKTAQERFTEEI